MKTLTLMITLILLIWPCLTSLGGSRPPASVKRLGPLPGIDNLPSNFPDRRQVQKDYLKKAKREIGPRPDSFEKRATEMMVEDLMKDNWSNIKVKNLLRRMEDQKKRTGE